VETLLAARQLSLPRRESATPTTRIPPSAALRASYIALMAVK